MGKEEQLSEKYFVRVLYSLSVFHQVVTQSDGDATNRRQVKTNHHAPFASFYSKQQQGGAIFQRTPTGISRSTSVTVLWNMLWKWDTVIQITALIINSLVAKHTHTHKQIVSFPHHVNSGIFNPD